MTVDATPLTVGGLLAEYRAGRLDPSAVAELVLERCEASSAQPMWIARIEADALRVAARELDAGERDAPLYGIPFALKDNIDVVGMATTAGLLNGPVAAATAPVVQRLLDAGALLVGKTNMDQLATGLVGTRTPHGACASVFDSGRVSGGSSSGSAVAVALGCVAFALGTDTAGSGRVPAAFNAVVGLKPTRGLLSTRGVLPACASLDCVSIFARDVADAARVLEVAAAPDPADPWSRAAPPSFAPRRGRLGVPRAGQLAFTEPEAQAAWEAALAWAGGRFELVDVDVAPLLAAAPLLYAAWVAERTTDLLARVGEEPPGLDPTVAAIIRGGAARSAVDVFGASHRLAALRLQSQPIWAACDALLLPTVPGHPTHAEVAADPLGANEALGRFTNFANLMDLTGVAVPGPARDDGLPAGITILAPAFQDARALELAAEWTAPSAAAIPLLGVVPLVVVGAHMEGLALNGQLTERGARRAAVTTTARCYRLYALPGDGPVVRPGLVRVAAGGASIAAEVWELAPAALGDLLALVPAPLAVGRVLLADGREVTGFVCEAYAVDEAVDVTEHGGWRAYLKSMSSGSRTAG